jgi:ribonuclease VapC
MKRILFDSHAILKFSQDEKGADKVEQFLLSSWKQNLTAYLSEINLGEIYYITIRRLGLESAKLFLEQLLDLPIAIISPSSEIIREAAEIKAQYAISFADCFAVATAIKYSASIITGDPEFKKVDHIITIEWL